MTDKRSPRNVIDLFWTLGFLVLALVNLGVGYHSVRPSVESWAWLIGVFILEATAVRLPGHGVYTSAVAFYLAGATFPSFGPAGVFIGLLFGLFIRRLSPRSSQIGTAENFSYEIPILGASLVLGLWEPMLGVKPEVIAYGFALITFLILDEAITRHLLFSKFRGGQRVAWLRLRRSLTETRIGVMFAGLVLLLLTSQAPWLPLVFAPILWLTHREVTNALFRVQASLAVEVERKAVRLTKDLEVTQKENVHLETAVGQLSVLLKTSRTFGGELIRQKLFALTERLAGEDFQATSGGIIWDEAQHYWGKGNPEALELARRRSRDEPGQYLGRLPREGKSFGYLFLCWSHPKIVTEDESRLFTAFAYALGMALENSSRYRQVSEAQQQLLESSRLRAVGQLAAGVAHELNSPLGAIRLALDALATQEINERGQKRIVRAQDACQRALVIVDKLLLYSQEKKRAPALFRAASALEDAVLFLSPTLQVNKVRMATEITTTAEVMGSSPEIQQVLINLILNAAQACEGLEDSRRLIQILCRENADWVEFLVQDQGPGIPFEIQDKIFEPFFTSKPVGVGTGLGLSISLEIAVNHGGELLLQESSAGRGAQFVLRLPKG